MACWGCAVAAAAVVAGVGGSGGGRGRLACRETAVQAAWGTVPGVAPAQALSLDGSSEGGSERPLGSKTERCLKGIQGERE